DAGGLRHPGLARAGSVRAAARRRSAGRLGRLPAGAGSSLRTRRRILGRLAVRRADPPLADLERAELPALLAAAALAERLRSPSPGQQEGDPGSGSEGADRRRRAGADRTRAAAV